MLGCGKGSSAARVMKKSIEIVVDEATFASAYDAYQIVLKQKNLPHQIIFYAADAVWREDADES